MGGIGYTGGGNQAGAKGEKVFVARQKGLYSAHRANNAYSPINGNGFVGRDDITISSVIRITRCRITYLQRFPYRAHAPCRASQFTQQSILFYRTERDFVFTNGGRNTNDQHRLATVVFL